MSISQKIADRFGSKKGVLRYFYFNFLNGLGRFRAHGTSNLAGTKRLVFICSGNICRSPFGEYVSKSLGFPAVSFGLHCRGGDKAFEKTISVAASLGYNLEEHRSINIKEYQPEEGDLLIAMEPAHVKELKLQYPSTPILLIGMLTDTKIVYLHDPYSTNQVFFKDCLQKIEQATKAAIKGIRSTS
ncbi:low molecular weight phosphatase family protein [Alteromonas pelagimontana]|uniref:protein-tyrosine-phosphatase n=1 Tax=Alteromonas pelagimontana TaxID=1858656 RepID=A0A6M4MHD8_9ALTE|nr:low molecular weight phosphatase family protein [Alteromonas pelagimontana]QJR81985.1 low molecular weight phosphatase family protein [Alteromonas pelagimontana]